MSNHAFIYAVGGCGNSRELISRLLPRGGTMRQEGLKFQLSSADVTDELIMRRCKTLDDALKLCRDCSPDDDKQIMEQIKDRTGYEFHKGRFSECFSGGTRNFPPKFIPVLEDICHNLIPTRFLALSRNCELRPKREAWEIENDRLREELDQMRKEKAAVTSFLRDARVMP